jgi:hypothetical protein
VRFVVDNVALGQVFSEYFGFPCPFSFHRLLHTHHLSSVAGTIGQLVADVPSGLSLTPPQGTTNYKTSHVEASRGDESSTPARRLYQLHVPMFLCDFAGTF